MSAIVAKCGTVVVMFLILCSSLSCQTHPNRVIHQTDELSVTLREIPAGYPLLAPYNHSYVLHARDTSDLLESLQYDVGSLLPFSRRQSHHVFSKDQVTLLAPALSKALSLALPEEVVAFSAADTEKSHRRTKGFVFILGNELHLIIEELRKPAYQGEQNTYQQQVPRWELRPGDTQRHYASRPGGKGAITNWIIIPLR